MQDLNYHFCLAGILWRQAQHSGPKEEIKDKISLSKITPNNDKEYKLLRKHVGHAYERCLQLKHHHNDYKPKDKRTIRASVIMMMIRGIKESRTLGKVLTPRNLERKRRVLSLSM
jgi:hypothetical protein